MECSEPGAIREEELLAYLAGEKVRAAVGQHLAVCQACAQRLATYRRIELKLTSKLYRWDCPPNQVLGEYQMGLLSREHAVEVKRHLRTCVLCTAEVAALTEFLANDPMLVGPVYVTQQSAATSLASRNNHRPVKEVQRVLENLKEQTLAGARRIIATLAPPQSGLAFQRDVASNVTAWPRRYVAEDFNVSIQVERGPGRRDALQLIGFVTRKGAALESLQGTTVRLTEQGSVEYTQSIDELGNFVFVPIVPGTYTLELQCPEGNIVIEQLPIATQE